MNIEGSKIWILLFCRKIYPCWIFSKVLKLWLRVWKFTLLTYKNGNYLLLLSIIFKCWNISILYPVYQYASFYSICLYRTKYGSIRCAHFQSSIHPSINYAMILKVMSSRRAILVYGFAVHVFGRYFPWFFVCWTLINVSRCRSWFLTKSKWWNLQK